MPLSRSRTGPGQLGQVFNPTAGGVCTILQSRALSLYRCSTYMLYLALTTASMCAHARERRTPPRTHTRVTCVPLPEPAHNALTTPVQQALSLTHQSLLTLLIELCALHLFISWCDPTSNTTAKRSSPRVTQISAIFGGVAHKQSERVVGGSLTHQPP